jgi:hypothetical protein
VSHCAEDRQWLAFPLYQRLKTRGLSPWLDTHDYPIGTDPYEALREGIVHCRHVVYLVTLAMLEQARGWPVLEKAYSGLLQDNLRVFGLELCHIELPLFFLPRAHPVLSRSVWQPILPRGKFHLAADGDAVDWAGREIEGFVRREERRAVELGVRIENDQHFQGTLGNRMGLMDRIGGAYPAIEPPDTD